jgi:outer membrane protein, heavy metal efflux system
MIQHPQMIKGKINLKNNMLMKFFFLFLFINLLYSEKISEKQKKARTEILASSTNKVAQATESNDAIYLKDVLDLVEKNFPLILALYQDLRIAESELLSARGAFDPNIKSGISSSPLGYYQNNRFDMLAEQPTAYNGISFFGGYRIGRGNFAPYDGKQVTNSLGEIRGGARIPLWRDRAIDRNRALIKQAELGIILADFQVSQQRIEIYRNATLRYWDFIAAGRRYEIAKSLYEIAIERKKQITKRIKAGDLPAIEEVENERVILQRESLLASSVQTLEITANELSIYLPNQNGILTAPKLEQIPNSAFSNFEIIDSTNQEDAIEKAIRVRPDLKRIDIQKQQNQIDQELSKNQMNPGVDMVIIGSQDLGTGSVTRSKFELEAGLVLNIPLRTRKEQGKFDGSVAKNLKLIEQEKFLKERIIADIKNAYTTVENTKKRAILASKEFELAKKLEEAERNRYIVGEGTLLIVNIREQTTGEAAIREVEALADHHRAIANYKASIAEVLVKDLTKRN